MIVGDYASLNRDIEVFANLFGVSPEIHPDDFIFKFVLGSVGHPKLPTIRECIKYYFEDGRKSADQFLRLIRNNRVRVPANVLEFAAGYGCVTRHLLRASDTNLCACDIHAKAVEFLRDRLFTNALISTSIPEDLTFPMLYDVVFALSFFSHMPIETWERWLRRLSSFTRIGGLFIFTTHGYKSLDHIDDVNIPDTGFWFRPNSEQKDLSAEEYGFTITTPEFVHRAIAKLNTLRLVEWREGFWWGHQDLYVLRKVATWWPQTPQYDHPGPDN